LKVKVHPDGTITHIYTDELDLSDMGKTTTKRASCVEPTEDNKWTADMGPAIILFGITGPIKRLLGPFPTRKEALATEVEWLEANIL
jgi:hypothetical protein